jgi:hypothetical protein
VSVASSWGAVVKHCHSPYALLVNHGLLLSQNTVMWARVYHLAPPAFPIKMWQMPAELGLLVLVLLAGI